MRLDAPVREDLNARAAHLVDLYRTYSETYQAAKARTEIPLR